MEQTFQLPQPTVVLAGLRDPGRRLRILGYLEKAGIRVIEAGPLDAGRTLGELLGLPGFPPAKTGGSLEPNPFREELLVMFAFRGTMMQEFLQFFRDQGLKPVALKAVATETNLRWSLGRLYGELSKERDWFLKNARV